MKMEVDDESSLLPSKLYAIYKDRSEKEYEEADYDSLLHDILLSLSTQGDIVSDKDFDFDININNIINNNDKKKKFQHCNDNIVTYFMEIITEGSLPTAIFSKYKDNNNNDNDDDAIRNGEEDSLLFEWSIAMLYIHELLPHIISTPFELHSIASQSLLFSSSSWGDSKTTSSTSHWLLCLILCTYSLQQCPIPLQKRWRRWQSLVCETLRIFQDYHNLQQFDSSLSLPSSSSSGVGIISSMWMHHIVPACIHVVNQLPLTESYHVAIFSGIVGISTDVIERIMMQYAHEQKLSIENSGNGKNDGDDLVDKNTIIWSKFWGSLSILYGTIQSISTSFNRFGNTVSYNNELITLLITPYLHLQPTREENRNDNIDFMIYKDNLSWWMIHHQNNNNMSCNEPQERIANMNTSINVVGLGLLALKAFHHKQRPMVYHPSYIWIVWFPHVIVLLRKYEDCYPLPILENESILFLQSLIQIIPEQSLVLEKERMIYDNPDASLELFYLLSNRLTTQIPKASLSIEDGEKGKEEGSLISPNNYDHNEMEFKLRSQQTVKLIKDTLNRFTKVSQVRIVDKLIMQNSCSTIPPGLQARFLDLLRPIILITSHEDLDPETDALLWNLLMSVINCNLFNRYWNRTEQTLINVEDLINRDVELTVGAITMIQLWASIINKGNKNLPANGNNNGNNIGEELQGFHNALKKQLEYWAENDTIINATAGNGGGDGAQVVPHDHYRLFLLDSAIGNTLNSILGMSQTLNNNLKSENKDSR